MFNECLDPIAPLTRGILAKMKRPQGEPDYALSSLAAALLKPRIANYNGIVGGFYKANTLNNVQVKNPDDIYFFIVSVTSGMTVDDLDIPEKLKRLTAIEQYVKSKTQIDLRIHIHTEYNAVFIVLPTLTMPLYHMLLSFFPKYYPKLFPNVSQQELIALGSLNMKSSADFIRAVSELLAPYRKEMLKQEFGDLMRDMHEYEIRVQQDNITRLDNEMEEYLSHYSMTARNRENAIIYLEGLKATIAQGTDADNELIEYVASNPCLHNVTYADRCLNLGIITYLTNVDVDKWMKAQQRDNIFTGYSIRTDNPFFKQENRKLFLNSLFGVEVPQLYVKLRSYLELNTDRKTLNIRMRNLDFSKMDYEFKSCLSNPHFAYHSCPGQNRGAITECLANGELISAIECCIAATGSVNIAETDITFRPFVQEILTSTEKIIHCIPTNTDMTPAEALLWLTEGNHEGN